MSFNARRLSQREARRSHEIGAMLRALAADICAIQEVLHECPDDGALARVAASARLAHVTFEPHAPFAARGVGLLHRHAAVARGGGRLPARAGDDKGFTRVVVALPLDRSLEIIAVHLDPFSHGARARQIAALAEAVGPRSTPRLVLGDFNAMTLRTWLARRAHDETVEEISRALDVAMPAPPAAGGTAPKTFPSRFPLFALDWVLGSSDLEVRAVESVRTRLSDHAAIVADVSFAPGEA